MKKILLSVLAVVALSTITGIAKALPADREGATVPSGITIKVPDIAIETSVAMGIQPGTFEKTIFIHEASQGNQKPAKATTCYKLLGVKWRVLPQDYVIHPNVNNTVPGAIQASVYTWDAATSKQLFGASTVDSTANWDGQTPDGRNEYSFGDYSQNGVIAVTVIWSGIPLGGGRRQIVEYDVMFDTDFAWGDATASSSTPVMDLENISTHETGHGLGLNDIYTASCSAVTMYGYSSEGDIAKRTLETPDILGLQKMYGM